MLSRLDASYSDTASFNLNRFIPLRTIWLAVTHLILTETIAVVAVKFVISVVFLAFVGAIGLLFHLARVPNGLESIVMLLHLHYYLYGNQYIHIVKLSRLHACGLLMRFYHIPTGLWDNALEINFFLPIISAPYPLSVCTVLALPMTDFRDYLLSQAIFWTISFIFHFKYVSSHQHLKLGGYFVFYKKMQKVASISFAVPSFFSSLLLAVVGILSKAYHLYPTYFDIKYETLLRYLMIAMISIELLVETAVLLKYIISVKKFNQQRPVPDVERFEYLLPSDARSSSEIGYRLEGEAVADLLEKQADLICYYKSTIIDLKSKLAEPQTCH